MLQYLVEETLAGRAQALKGYNIGVSVFRRGEDFDAQADPVVRLEARRLRRDLASYYVSEGRTNPLRIAIPKGHYAPEFHRNERDPTLVAPSWRGNVADEVSDIVFEPRASRTAAADPTLGVPFRRYLWLVGTSVLATLIAIVAFGFAVSGALRVRVPAEAQGPSVMVLPFEVNGAAAEDSFVAAGLADQIVSDLSRFADFRIYLPKASPRQDVFAVGEQSGVRYLVSGRVSIEDSKVRIGLNLLEVPSGRVLWADNFDKSLTLNSLLSVQNDIAAAVATTLGQPYGVIKTEMTKQYVNDFRPSIPSYECVLRSYAYRRNFSSEQHAPVLACLQAAVKREPQYADAWAMLGWLYLDAGRFNLTTDIASNYDLALEAATRVRGGDKLGHGAPA